MHGTADLKSAVLFVVFRHTFSRYGKGGITWFFSFDVSRILIFMTLHFQFVRRVAVCKNFRIQLCLFRSRYARR